MVKESKAAQVGGSKPLDAAVHTLRTALRYDLRGGRGLVYYNLGNLLHQKFSLSSQPNQSRDAVVEAMRCFRAAAALIPSHTDAYYNLGLAPQQAHLDAPRESEAAFRHALAITPDHPKIWSRLVTTLQWAGRTAEADTMIQTAVRMGVWKSQAQRPSTAIAGLRAQPWHKAADYHSLFDALRASHARLVQDFETISQAGGFLPQPEGLQEAGQRWEVFDLSAACATISAPKPYFTCALLSRLRTMGSPARNRSRAPYAPLKAQFSTMAAGVHVRPHTGPTNGKLTAHYGLVVPTGASVRVVDEWRHFAERELLVFDDSFEHEVWQNGSSDRTTLVLHLAHPDLLGGLAQVGTPE